MDPGSRSLHSAGISVIHSNPSATPIRKPLDFTFSQGTFFPYLQHPCAVGKAETLLNLYRGDTEIWGAEVSHLGSSKSKGAAAFPGLPARCPLAPLDPPPTTNTLGHTLGRSSSVPAPTSTPTQAIGFPRWGVASEGGADGLAGLRCGDRAA